MIVNHEDCRKSWKRIVEKQDKYPYPPADIIKRARDLFELKFASSSGRIAHIASDVCVEFSRWNVARAINDLVVDKIGKKEWN